MLGVSDGASCGLPEGSLRLSAFWAAELDGRAENYDGMDAASKRKASREMKKLIGKVEEMRSAIDANAAEIESRIDAVGGKIDEVGGKVEAVGKKVNSASTR